AASGEFPGTVYLIFGEAALARMRRPQVSLEAVMKSRLSGTIWGLIALNAVAYAAAIYFAFNAGKQTGGGGTDSTGLFIAGGVAAVASIILAWRLGGLITPVHQLAEFSERLAAGDPRARAEVQSNDEFGYIAENLNRAVAKVSKANSNQEASDSL